MISVEMDGLDGLLAQMDAAQRALAAGAERAATQAAELAVRYAREEILSAHVSMPGAPPKSVTGALIASMSARAIAGGGSEFRVDSDHAKHVEYGTRKMRPHPYAGPAIERAKREFMNTLIAMVTVSVRFNVLP